MQGHGWGRDGDDRVDGGAIPVESELFSAKSIGIVSKTSSAKASYMSQQVEPTVRARRQAVPVLTSFFAIWTPLTNN